MKTESATVTIAPGPTSAGIRATTSSGSTVYVGRRSDNVGWDIELATGDQKTEFGIGDEATVILVSLIIKQGGYGEVDGAADSPSARPGSYVNGAGIKASDTPVEVVRKLDAAWASATGHKWDPLPSPTSGFDLGERIAHVGGRTNAAGYVEFGSPMAVQALIQQVIRDTCAPAAQAGDASGVPA